MGCTPCKPHKTAPGQRLTRTLSVAHQYRDVQFRNSSFIGLRRQNLRTAYEIGATLGSGAYGLVRLGTHKQTGALRAIKTIHKSHITADLRQRANFFSEIDTLKQIDHPNIVKLYEFFSDQGCYHLVTEYVQGGMLLDLILKQQHMSEREAAGLIRQVLSAMAYCHSRGIVHRDLKPENLLLTEQSTLATVKVIDFGTAAITRNEKMTKTYGTPFYVAPEVLKKSYDEKCDLWSIGVILYMVLSGEPPFTGNDDKDLLANVLIGHFTFEAPIWKNISNLGKSYIRSLMKYNPELRISANQALNHPWLEQAQQGTIETQQQTLALNSISNFRTEKKIQHAVLTYIASQLAKNEQIKQLNQLFRSIDTDGDGTLCYQELLHAYKKINGANTQEEVRKIMEEVDINNSGAIDYTQFIMAAIERNKVLSEQNLRLSFDEFDVDKNGTISANELKEVLGSEQDMPQDIWNQLVLEADMNGDGEIDYSEFSSMMNGILTLT